MSAHRLISAIQIWLDARADVTRCYEGCDTSPGYRCRGPVAREEKALLEVQSAFDEAVDERVKMHLALNGIGENA